MTSPDGEARTYLTVVLPTSTPQIIAPFWLGASFSGVLISIMPGSRMRGAILTKFPSAIKGSSQVGQPLLAVLLANVRCRKNPHSQEWLCYFARLQAG